MIAISVLANLVFLGLALRILQQRGALEYLRVRFVSHEALDPVVGTRASLFDVLPRRTGGDYDR